MPEKFPKPPCNFPAPCYNTRRGEGKRRRTYRRGREIMTKDLTSGSPLKVILLFTLPLVLGNLFQQFYALADTIIVGRYCGVSALA